MATSHELEANGVADAGETAVIDLRSDTVTRPSTEMFKSLAELQRSDLGDDIYGEDPTVNELQREAAALTGKEAALFVPTGTQANLAACLAHAGRGDELLLGDESHIYHYESGGVSALGGCVMHVLPTLPNGEIPLAALEQALRDRPPDQHSARPALVCLESTHNRCGGRVLSISYMSAVAEWAAQNDLPVHLDGARVFNAAAALGVPVKEIAALTTSMSFCLSKGLGAPVGSMIVGSAAFIARAHRLRKQLGGAMRQVGVLAAPALVALRQTPPLLAQDHANARLLAKELATMEHVEIDEAAVESNIVLWHLKPSAPSAAVVMARLKAAGILLGGMRGGIRAVTHIDVTQADVKRAVVELRKALTENNAAE